MPSSNDQGPPNLDDLFAKWMQKIGSLFGKKRPSVTILQSPQHNGRKGLRISFGLVIGLIVFIWLISGVFIVSPPEEAAITTFGKYQSTVGPGPHWIPRFIQSETTVNIQKISTYSYNAQMLTRDQNIVDVAVAVQYRISNARDYLYNVVDPTTSLQQATASALRQVIGNTTLDDILTTGRAVVRDQVAVQLQNILSLYNAGITISDVALQPAKAPEQVKDAFDDAINAQEDEQRFENQAEAYAMGVVPIAQGHAQRISQEAQAYQQQVVLQAQADVARFLAVLPVYESAPVVTRERLYLTTLQDIFTRSNKVFLDTKQGSNFYLPLNQWPTANKTPVMNQARIDDMTSSLAKTGDLASSNADTSNRPDRFSNNPDGQIGAGDQS